MQKLKPLKFLCFKSRNKKIQKKFFHLAPSSPNNLVVNFTQSGIQARWEASSEPRGRIQYKLFGLVNGSKLETFCNECGLQYLVEDVASYTVYTLWALAYNVDKDYESPPSLNVTIDTSLYGK